MNSEQGRGDTQDVSASASGVWGRLSNLWRYRSISVEKQFVSLVRTATGRSERLPIMAIDAVSWWRSGLSARLRLETSGGRSYVVGGLPAGEAAQLVAVLEQRAEREAELLDQRGRALAARLNEWFSARRFLRASEVDPIRTSLADLAGQVVVPSGALTRRHLSHLSRKAFSCLPDLITEEGWEQARRSANERFVQRESKHAAAAMERINGFHPVSEQAEAIATDEDVTLVLAGAGTGKTAVITGKVGHLIDNCQVAAESIIVLAYNKNAAAEIRARLGELGVDVATFHAFAMRMAAQNDVKPSISPLADDNRLLQATIDRILEALLRDPEQGAALQEFILYNLGEYRAPEEFARPADYYEYLQRVELRTLNGELVRSMEELKIANFLALHGVRYRYEQNYSVRTATQAHRQYKPDFYLPGHDLYIEHIGIDRRGEPPPYWSDEERREYRRGIEWKREIHAEHGTTLIETYSWQHREGIWRQTLSAQLRAEAVGLSPRPIEELLQQLRALMRSSQLSGLLLSFLRHVKSGDYNEADLRDRAQQARDPGRAEVFFDLFAAVRRSYESALGDEYDFDDLINKASEQIRAGCWRSPYRYILVDEFQDISRGRMQLLAALRQPETAYFLVGDDWQSIYRFAGSDIGLLHDCGEWLGSVEQRALSQTFRFAQGIQEPSSAFIQRNPAQSRRRLRPARRDPDHGVTLVWSRNSDIGLGQVSADLDRRGVDRDVSLLALGRYRDIRPVRPMSSRRVEFNTVHAAKGREADYVLLLDVNGDRRRGFPSQIEDDPLLDLVAPPRERFDFAEERRLFYVALTRARHGVYLLADPDKPSRFVYELIKQSPGKTRVLGETSPVIKSSHTCPACRGGQLIPALRAASLRCNLAPQCDYHAPQCGCRAGYLILDKQLAARCTNQNCQRAPQHCPNCSTGVLVERVGRYGSFWGCSRYGSDPSCDYTRNYQPNSSVGSRSRSGRAARRHR